MILIMRRKIWNKLSLLYLFNTFTILFISCIRNNSNEVGVLDEYLNMDQPHKELYTRIERILANDILDSEIEQREPQVIHEETRKGNILNNHGGSTQICDNLNKNKPKNMYNHIKKLQYGYANKKGFKRLDCYYEMKIFEKMEKLEKCAKKMNISKKEIKRKFCNRHVLPIIIILLFLLVIFVGLVVITYIRKDKGESKSYENHEPFIPLLTSTCALYIPQLIVLFSSIIYIMKKVGKYSRIKSKEINNNT
ncbi:Plasmodium exported protein, unknown function [Plasmodium vivax]|uniref:Uncharacterized protein n=1 Tax=Plasmodium vivax TaxID=5855 RepID=A0A565A4V4_PLAVI|nr:Plasmodium exported protein, unknown function [Plasmodium vivax]